MSLFPMVQSSLAFPLPLSEKYRPQRIEDFIGLDKQKKILSAFAKRPCSCAWLFVGPSGTGKSTMAMALCQELAGELHKIPSQRCTVQNIDDTVRSCWYAPMTVGGFHVVLCDEADAMPPTSQLRLLSNLDSTDPAPSTIWIFTANDVERLEKRFLSRCRVLEFSSYGLRTPLAEFLAQVWKSETGQDGALDWERIAKDQQNNVRGALSALELELLAA